MLLLAAYLLLPTHAYSYAEGAYYGESYYQGYYESYYQGYYQGYYQSYYQSYYEASYQTTFTKSASATKNFAIVGSVSKGSGTFVIDHPLDPANKLLYHSFVESPDVKNIYDGIVILDGKGEAVVDLPHYYGALNTDSRYQLRALYQSMPLLYVKEEVKENRFKISGGAPNGRVSWQVTGIRHDPYIKANPVIVEQDKTDTTIVMRGEFISPEAYGSIKIYSPLYPVIQLVKGFFR